MATIAQSNEYVAEASGITRGNPRGMYAKFFEGVTATAATGTIDLIKLPPGRLRIHTRLCTFFMANGASGANVSIGVNAYTAANGLAVAANAVELKSVGLVNAAGSIANSQCFTAPANASLLLDTLTGADIYATIATANTAANGAFQGYIVFEKF